LLSAAAVANVREVAGALLSHWSAYDFSYAYYPAAVRLLHGVSPYAQSQAAMIHGTAFVYPALSAIVFVPFGLLGVQAATHLYMLLCVFMVPLTLWVSGVRDWRIYVVVMLWRPVQDAWLLGNVSAPLACLSAVAWRYRDRPLVAGLAIAVAISIKPLVWPLALFLLATRRWRAAAWTLAFGLGLNALSWLVVGFGQIHPYLRASADDLDVFWRYGCSLTSVASKLGLSRGVGEAAMVAIVAALVVAIVRAGRRRDDVATLTLTVVAVLVASPIVWTHDFILLIVPLAAARPRLSILWFVPVAMWVCSPMAAAPGWQVAVAWLATAGALLPLFALGRGGRMLD